jgi:hypothetical protein
MFYSFLKLIAIVEGEFSAHFDKAAYSFFEYHLCSSSSRNAAVALVWLLAVTGTIVSSGEGSLG